MSRLAARGVSPVRPSAGVSRRGVTALLGAALAGCGGGSDESTIEGSIEGTGIVSQATGTAYPLNIYRPPASAGSPGDWPTLFVLDGESWFYTLVNLVEIRRLRLIVVAVQTAGQRARDFVPANTCTPGGGGHAAYFDFVRDELVPTIEASVGGHPGRRMLFGHSHGASFVLYAMFAQAPGAHTFSSYLACDASLGCMPAAAAGWEQAYAAAHASLPVHLHLSCASQGNLAVNVAYAAGIAARGYQGLALAAPVYTGTHGGVVPQALGESITFGLGA